MKNIRFFRTLAIMLTGVSLLFGCGNGKPSVTDAAADAARAALVSSGLTGAALEDAIEAVADAKNLIVEFGKGLAAARPSPACGLFDLGFMVAGGVVPAKIEGTANGGTGSFEIKKSSTDAKVAEYTFIGFSPNAKSKYTLTSGSTDAKTDFISIKKITATSATDNQGSVNGNLLLKPISGDGNFYQIKFNSLDIKNTSDTCGKITSIQRSENSNDPVKVAAAKEEYQTYRAGVTAGTADENIKRPKGSRITLSYKKADTGSKYVEIDLIFDDNTNTKNEELLKLLFTE